MSLIGSIVTKILNFQGIHPRRDGPGAPSVTSPANAAPASPQSPPASTPPSATEAQAVPASPAPSASPSPATGTPAAQPVDVEEVLSGLAARSGQKLNWQTSIVDLLKLLDLDSSLTARKQLAEELHYTGDTNDSAKMNIWLHKQVMQKLEENGGRVPASLKNHT